MFNQLTKELLPGWPHNQLERAFEEAVRDPGNLPRLWPIMLRSSLYTLAQDMTPEQHAQNPGGSCLAVFVSNDGSQAIMAFSSLEVAQAAIKAPTPITQSAVSTLADYLGDIAVLLNPSGPVSRHFPAAELRAGRDGVSRVGASQLHVAANTPVQFEPLLDEPLELIESIVAVCRTDDDARAAYLSGVRVPAAGDVVPHPLVGLDAVDYTALRARVSRAVAAWTARNHASVDFVDMSQKDAFSTHLKKAGRRIYKRGGWLGGLLG